mgnify:CR=1 FL=1
MADELVRVHIQYTHLSLQLDFEDYLADLRVTTEARLLRHYGMTYDGQEPPAVHAARIAHRPSSTKAEREESIARMRAALS